MRDLRSAASPNNCHVRTWRSRSFHGKGPSEIPHPEVHCVGACCSDRRSRECHRPRGDPRAPLVRSGTESRRPGFLLSLPPLRGERLPLRRHAPGPLGGRPPAPVGRPGRAGRADAPAPPLPRPRPDRPGPGGARGGPRARLGLHPAHGLRPVPADGRPGALRRPRDHPGDLPPPLRGQRRLRPARLVPACPHGEGPDRHQPPGCWPDRRGPDLLRPGGTAGAVRHGPHAG